MTSTAARLFASIAAINAGLAKVIHDPTPTPIGTNGTAARAATG